MRAIASLWFPREVNWGNYQNFYMNIQVCLVIINIWIQYIYTAPVLSSEN